jgi:hypothetical protein
MVIIVNEALVRVWKRIAIIFPGLTTATAGTGQRLFHQQVRRREDEARQHNDEHGKLAQQSEFICSIHLCTLSV